MEIRITKTSAILFTLIFIAALVSVFIYVAFGQHTKYLTQIQESVSGLHIGSRVEYNGVEVGTVKRIKINRDNPKLVNVVLSIDSSTPVTTATVAMLAANDAKDTPFIALRDDGSNLARLKIKTGQQYPVIPSVPSTKADNNVSLTQIAASLKQFNDTFQQFMDKDAVESFKQLIYSLQQVMGMLAENSNRLNTLIMNTEKASNKFDSFLSSSQLAIHTLQTQTLPSTYELVLDMQSLMSKLSVMMTEINQNPSIVLRGKTPPKPGPGE